MKLDDRELQLLRVGLSLLIDVERKTRCKGSTRAGFAWGILPDLYERLSKVCEKRWESHHQPYWLKKGESHKKYRR